MRILSTRVAMLFVPPLLIACKHPAPTLPPPILNHPLRQSPADSALPPYRRLGRSEGNPNLLAHHYPLPARRRHHLDLLVHARLPRRRQPGSVLDSGRVQLVRAWHARGRRVAGIRATDRQNREWLVLLGPGRDPDRGTVQPAAREPPGRAVAGAARRVGAAAGREAQGGHRVRAAG